MKKANYNYKHTWQNELYDDLIYMFMGFAVGLGVSLAFAGVLGLLFVLEKML